MERDILLTGLRKINVVNQASGRLTSACHKFNRFMIAVLNQKGESDHLDDVITMFANFFDSREQYTVGPEHLDEFERCEFDLHQITKEVPIGTCFCLSDHANLLTVAENSFFKVCVLKAIYTQKINLEIGKMEKQVSELDPDVLEDINRKEKYLEAYKQRRKNIDYKFVGIINLLSEDCMHEDYSLLPGDPNDMFTKISTRVLTDFPQMGLLISHFKEMHWDTMIDVQSNIGTLTEDVEAVLKEANTLYKDSTKSPEQTKSLLKDLINDFVPTETAKEALLEQIDQNFEHSDEFLMKWTKKIGLEEDKIRDLVKKVDMVGPDNIRYAVDEINKFADERLDKTDV